MAKFFIVRGSTSNILDVFLASSASTTGAGLTGLDNTSAGLLISVKRELSSTYTVYTGNSTIQTITTIGTYAAPSASNCRFKVIDATNAAGMYQIMFADSIFGTSDASRWVTGIIWGATNLAPTPFEIQLVADSPEIAKPTNYASLSIDGSGRVDVIKVAGTTQTARDLGTSVLISSGTGTGQLNVTSGVVDANTTKISGTSQTARDLGSSVLLSSGSGTGQLDFTSGVVKANLAQILATALTETSGLIAAAFKQFFNIASPTGTVNLIPTTTTVTNRVTANTDQLAGSATAATNISTSALAIYVGTITGASPTTTTLIDTGLSAQTNNFYKDRCIVFTTGTQKYQLKDITAYTGASDTLTFNAFTGAPAQGDQYVIL